LEPPAELLHEPAVLVSMLDRVDMVSGT
jgi:hypothetical protein